MEDIFIVKHWSKRGFIFTFPLQMRDPFNILANAPNSLGYQNAATVHLGGYRPYSGYFVYNEYNHKNPHNCTIYLVKRDKKVSVGHITKLLVYSIYL